MAIRCDDEQIEIPMEWVFFPLSVEFSATSTRKISHIDPDRLARLLTLLRAHPELVAYLEGRQVERGDTRQAIHRRMDTVRGHLQRLGVPPGRVQFEQRSHAFVRGGHAVDIYLTLRYPDPVALGEPCGIKTLRIPARSFERRLAAHGLWAQDEFHIQGIHNFHIAAGRVPLEPFQGSDVAPLVRHDGGYLAADWNSLTDTIAFGLFDRHGRLQRVASQRGIGEQRLVRRAAPARVDREIVDRRGGGQHVERLHPRRLADTPPHQMPKHVARDGEEPWLGRLGALKGRCAAPRSDKRFLQGVVHVGYRTGVDDQVAMHRPLVRVNKLAESARVSGGGCLQERCIVHQLRRTGQVENPKIEYSGQLPSAPVSSGMKPR